jgi:hypothetical protein
MTVRPDGSDSRLATPRARTAPANALQCSETEVNANFLVTKFLKQICL